MALKKFQMKPNLILLIFSLFLISCKHDKKNDSIDKSCEDWYVKTYLYNNYISDSTQIRYWENYWDTTSGNKNKLIPDSLAIVLDFIPSLSILAPQADVPDSKYYVKTILKYKYSKHDDSYCINNPIVSNDIIIFEKEINLKEIYEKFIHTDQMGYSFYPKKIPIKKPLYNLNILTGDVMWNFEKQGAPYALNQIIVSTYFMDSKGNICCFSELTFPINGFYGDSNAGGNWEY